MVIEIHLHTILQRRTKSGTVGKISLGLPPESTLAEVLAKLEISYPLDGLLLVLNGRTADLESHLKDGDVVHIIPALSGG